VPPSQTTAFRAAADRALAGADGGVESHGIRGQLGGRQGVQQMKGQLPLRPEGYRMMRE